MKIVLCTTPIRPVPTEYPPFGSIALMQAMREAGYNPVFFDIDSLRPTFEEVIERFRKEAPDVIGVSAVVSTAYAYVKKLCTRLKQELPGVRIVLGGNLAASAELLHRFCQVDVCVAGEGERVLVNLLRYFELHPNREEYGDLRQVPGITFLDSSGQMIFTGYEPAIPANELADPDWSILEEFSNIQNFVRDPSSREDFSQDPRSGQAHRAGKRLGTVTSTKGCVARCTFCHRWDRGFRQISPEKVLGRVRYLMDRYNVGFFQFGDENFGSDLKALDRLIELIRPLDILWQVAGVRARTLNPDRLKRMREAGCVALYYGFETGSPDILKVMEKNTDLSHNLNAARWTHEAGLYTCYQLVLGMPGETHRTIGDTITMLKQITEFLPAPPYWHLSTNYIQALPGTPVYEFARNRGLLGPRLEDEDDYLLSVSDTDAGDENRFVNYTEYPYLTVQSWRPRILYEITAHWHRVRKNRTLPHVEPKGHFKEYQKGGYFNRHKVQRSPRVMLALYPFRGILVALWTLVSAYRRNPRKVFLRHLWEWTSWRFTRRTAPFRDYRSLRQVVREMVPVSATVTEESMMPLRAGR